jgi:hypothetical protein
MQCLRDPDFVKAMDAGRSWGFHDGACIFSADLVNKLDSGVPRDRNVSIAILKVPAHMSYTSFQQKMEALLDGILDSTTPSLTTTMVCRGLDIRGPAIRHFTSAVRTKPKCGRAPPSSRIPVLSAGPGCGN